MIYDEGDGWRNEDSEGPYIDALRTKWPWSIFRATSTHRADDLYVLSCDSMRFPAKKSFNSIAEAKDYVKSLEINVKDSTASCSRSL